MSTFASRTVKSSAYIASTWIAYLISAIAYRRYRIVGALGTLMCAALLAVGADNARAALDSPRPKHEEPDLLLRIIAQHVVLRPSASQGSNNQRFTVQCPNGHVPGRYSIAPAYGDESSFVQTSEQMIDRTSAPLDRTSLDSAAQMNGAGYVITLELVAEARQSLDLELALLCLSFASSVDSELSLVKSQSVAPAQMNSTQSVYCPPDHPTALGGFSNSDASALIHRGSAPAWGTASNPIGLQALEDGPTGPPSGWESKVYNRDIGHAPFVAYAICASAPTVRSYIYSTPTQADQRFSIWAPAPDTAIVIAVGGDGGAYGIDNGFDAWMRDGTVVNFKVWQATSTYFDSTGVSVRAYVAQGIDGRIKATAAGQAPGRAVAAVLAIPDSDLAAPTYTVNVIEFYNAALDHYFITSALNEILDLDDGIHPGWARTGQSFKAYGNFSGGPIGRRPVCRAYGKPEAGLDSHFYSASHEECVATLTRLDRAWGHETSEVFQLYVPDLNTGACPAGGVPVYRTWNTRTDSNHRYMTSMATRDQMIAKGHLAEGYGPSSVALCALQ